MADRYFVEAPIQGDRVLLGGAESHHLLHVMRARPGTEVVLFDGSGVEFLARVERTERSQVELAVLERREIDRELPIVVTLGVSLPKGDRQKWLVEKAVELGLRRLVPLTTARSVAQPVDNALERLRRSVVEASKQCARNRLMEIGPPQHWNQFVLGAGVESPRWLAHPARGNSAFGAVLRSSATEEVCLAVGPEGGFTSEEVAMATAAGWQTVDLGPRILRVETAAILLLGLVAQRHGAQPDPGTAASV
ncbi:MAG: 16S rRNA (uracil(1498)-N(3))-methyltransferase [Pirellulales bacterium]|nr:16S rRNA (uracil(1498)-N(3))-methyltransferase [Pirellulales bacterium]